MRIFIAHKKRDLDDYLDRVRVNVSAAMSANGPVEVTLGREDYDTRFGALGSWEAWVHDVACGTDFSTQKPRFDAIVVPGGPDKRVGSATARMIELAVSNGRPVAWTGDEGKTFSRVLGVHQVARSWVDGFEVRL